MSDATPHVLPLSPLPAAATQWAGRVLMLGFGNIGQAMLPFLLGRLGITPERIAILTACERGAEQAAAAGISRTLLPITRENMAQTLDERLAPGDLLLNLAVNVSSVDVSQYCMSIGAHYLDTSVEPWAGGYVDPRLPYIERCNFGLRRLLTAAIQRHPAPAPTALIGCGANPGLVSLVVKRALLSLLASRADLARPEPTHQGEWADLAQALSVKVVHITERDTQATTAPLRANELANTWSIGSLLGEAYLPSELAFGTHEPLLPADAHYHDGPACGSIYLERPGALNRTRSWLPQEGQFGGYIISHPETLSIADYLTSVDGDARVVHRPTVLFAYRPCDSAMLALLDIAGRDFRAGDLTTRVIVEEVSRGEDQLGVLLMGQPGRAFWFGSQLRATDAQRLAPHNNATSLQVCAGVLAGIVWLLEHPAQGLCEPEAIDVHQGLEVAAPYLGDLSGVWTKWTPTRRRFLALPDVLDRTEPWAFSNFRLGG